MDKGTLLQRAKKLVDGLDSRFEPQRRRTMAIVSAVQQDAAGRVIGATATIDGLPNQQVAVSVGTPITAGDVWEVANMGGRTTPSWATVRRLAATLAAPQLLVMLVLPTPTGFSLDGGTYVPVAGGYYEVWMYAAMHYIPDRYGDCWYDVEYRKDSTDDPTMVTRVPQTVPTTLAVDISATDTVIPRAVSDIGWYFPRFGRIQINAEQIDFERRTFSNGTSGTGTAGDDGTPYVEDSGAAWNVNQWQNYALYQNSGAIIARIISNTATRLYLDRAGASASYNVYPAFVGCTRGVNSTSATTHDADDAIISRSTGIMVKELQPDTDYTVRCRARRPDGAVSEWTAWDTMEGCVDTTAPPDPTGFSVSVGVGAINFSWTGPVLSTTKDLAGFTIYKATDSTGTGATAILTVAPGTTATWPTTAGTIGYFNIKAFDLAHNYSDYGESTWLIGCAATGTGQQIVTNADFELGGNNGSAWIDGWDINTIVPASGWDPWLWSATAGIDGGAAMQFSNVGYYDWSIGTLVWPGENTFLEYGIEDGIYTFQIHVTTPPDDWTVHYFYLGAHDGAGNFTWLTSGWQQELDAEQVSTEWWKLSWRAQWKKPDSSKVYIAAQYGTGIQTVVGLGHDIDRPMLALGGDVPTWTLRLQPLDGLPLRLDVTGIMTSDGISIDKDGLIQSDIVAAADDTYDLGSSTAGWKDLYLAGDLDIDGGVIGDLDPATDDTYDLGAESTARWRSIYISNTVRGTVESLQKCASLYQMLPGLRGYWPGSSMGGGAYMIDLSGQGRTLSPHHTERFGYSGLVPYVRLDGTGDYFSRADEGALSITGTETYVVGGQEGITIGCWCRPEDFSNLQGLMSKWGSAGQRSYLLRYNADAAGDYVGFQISDDGTNSSQVISTSGISSSDWHLVVGRFNDSETGEELSVRLDGTTYTASTSRNSIYDSTAPFEVGSYNAGSLYTGRFSQMFLCAAWLDDDLLDYLYENTRQIFGV